MKVYYIWNTETKKTLKSHSHRSGLYLNLVSAVFAYAQMSNFNKNKKYILKIAELTNEMEIET